MTFRLSSPNIQFANALGVPLAGGFLYFYQTGTSTPQNTYQDAALTIANTNPIVLDSGGYAGNIFLIQGANYKVVLTDANNVQQWAIDPVSDPTSGGGTFNGYLAVNGASGSLRNIELQTSGTNRFVFGLTADPETGSNVGSNIIAYVCADNGTLLQNVFSINRATGVLTFIKTPVVQQPTATALTSGTAATYTTPLGAVRLRVRMIGAGGGGGATGTGTSGGNGATGGTTSFGSFTALGGSGGNSNNGANGGNGGYGGSGGSGTAFFRIAGQAGAPGQYNSTVVVPVAGIGGSSAFGGAGTNSSGISYSQMNAVANSGSGGAGAWSATANIGCGGGGAAGEYAEFYINFPAASYTYTVGAAGAAGASGTSGANGGAGGSGVVLIEEYYY